MPHSYQRIVSLVPSLTELLIDLGLKDQLAGRTRFCVHPKKEVQDIPIMGGTKNPRIDKITDANPDFIIANNEENRKEHVQQLRMQTDAHIEVTDIDAIEDALLAIHQLGTLLGVEEKATELINNINGQLDKRPDEQPLRTAYFIWEDPWMTIGGDTYIHDVLQKWNLHNVFGHKQRYPTLQLDDLAARNPELVLLSSEPYPFKEQHLPMVEEACPDARVLLVEGEWFSWYGSHMLHAFKRLNVWRRAIS